MAKLVGALRQRYENTNQTLYSIAAEFQISTRNLSRMAAENGWAKRSERVQGLPVAMQLLEEAKALGAQSAHSRDSGNPVLSEGAKTEPPEELGPRLRRDERAESAAAPPECEQAPTPTLPLSGGGSPSAGETTPTAIERLEALVLQEIEAEEAARAQLGGKPRGATASERSARTLATLTQTLHTLQRLRAGALPEHESLYDDDMPADIDEFRLDLARRIEAFMESRPDDGDAEGNADAAPLDAAR